MLRVQQLSAQRLHVLHQQISRCVAQEEDGEVEFGTEVVLDAQAFISNHLSLEVHKGRH